MAEISGYWWRGIFVFPFSNRLRVFDVGRDRRLRSREVSIPKPNPWSLSSRTIPGNTRRSCRLNFRLLVLCVLAVFLEAEDKVAWWKLRLLSRCYLPLLKLGTVQVDADCRYDLVGVKSGSFLVLTKSPCSSEVEVKGIEHEIACTVYNQQANRNLYFSLIKRSSR